MLCVQCGQTAVFFDFDQTLTLKPAGLTSSGTGTPPGKKAQEQDDAVESKGNNDSAESDDQIELDHAGEPVASLGRFRRGVGVRGGEATLDALRRLHAVKMPMCVITAQPPTSETVRSMAHEVRSLVIAQCTFD